MSDQTPTYHRALPLTEAQVEQMCSDRVYRLALQYVSSAHVIDRMRVASSLSAKFHGTRGIYATRVSLSGKDLHFECTCPLSGSREPCKHVIALALIWVRQPETFHDLELTLARLAHMKKADLITLIRQAATRLPELIPLLDRPTRP
jgi:uncharacterized Zn finger protein